jgi:ABC-type uncharacterized transport system permease subunit
MELFSQISNKEINELHKIYIADIERLVKLIFESSQQLNTKQKKKLSEYFHVSVNLTLCLNVIPNVSPEVREEIEETLLLPLEEIENWKQEHRPSNPTDIKNNSD